ncbi:MAG: hypothetical protein N2319_06465 [Candidatus Kapabacteria bacterium]|nr:hypothetical protein [Candidatus Kapabacteria bacterium]
MLYVLVVIISILLLWRGLRFLTTPFFKKIGFYQYHSPMFFTISLTPKLYEIHLGTSWDFFKMQKINPKLQMIYLTQGLLNLCEKIEAGLINPKATIKGNLYFLKESSVLKFGFHIRDLNLYESLLTFFNIIESSILLSISYKRLSFVRLNDFKVIYISAYELLQNKQKFRFLLSKMTNHEILDIPKKSLQVYKETYVA